MTGLTSLFLTALLSKALRNGAILNLVFKDMANSRKYSAISVNLDFMLIFVAE